MYFYRCIEEKLLSDVSHNKIRLIFGARQVGKTMLLKYIFSEDNSIFYNLQDSTLRRQLERDVSMFSREIKALSANITNIFVDEIQKVPALLDEIQFIYDQNKTRFQFYLTGSSARKLIQNSVNLLPGRSHIYNLFPVISAEEHKTISRICNFLPGNSNPFPARSLEKKLFLGNLPVIINEQDETAIKTLEGYVTHYIEEEIRKESVIKNIGAFENFLRFAAIDSGRQINITKISQESGIPVSTIKNYYQILVDTFIGYWLSAYKRSERKRLLTTPAFFFFDTGVRNASLGVSNETFLLESGGKLFKHLVGLELIQTASYLGSGFSVSFWRTVSGAEVDFIFETPQEDIPVEVKWTDNPTDKSARNVLKFINLHPERAKRGFVVCRVKRTQQISENVLAIPFSEI